MVYKNLKFQEEWHEILYIIYTAIYTAIWSGGTESMLKQS